MRGSLWLLSSRIELLSAACAATLQHRQQLIETSHQYESDRDTEEELDNRVVRDAELIIWNHLNQAGYLCGLAVKVSVDGKTKLRGAYGTKDVENMIVADRADVKDFRSPIWSSSKPFTAYCWMKHFNESSGNTETGISAALNEDFPKTAYVQVQNRLMSDGEGVAVEWNNSSYHIEYFKRDLKDLKVKRKRRLSRTELNANHLLTHATGIMRQPPDEADFRAYDSSHQWYKRYKSCFHLFDYYPLTRQNYSNMGFDLIAVMLERLKSQNFTTYGRNQLAALNMPNTDFYRPDHVKIGEIFQSSPLLVLLGGAPEDEDGVQARASASNLTSKNGSSGLVSDVDDMNTFGIVTARMYQQTFIDDTPNLNTKLPLDQNTVMDQFNTLLPIGYDKEKMGFNEYAAGWMVFRQLDSNTYMNRNVRVLLHHSGLGLGVRTYLGIGFHNLDVDYIERENKKKNEPRQRQMDPRLFANRKVDVSNVKTYLDGENITRWELPLMTKVLFADERNWLFAAEQIEENTKKRLTEMSTLYEDNAKAYLYLIEKTEDKDFCESRLKNLLSCWEQHLNYEMFKVARLERKIMLTLGRERCCSKWGREDLDVNEAHAKKYRDKCRAGIEKHVGELKGSLSKFANRRPQDIDQLLGPGSEGNVNYYTRQPFNISSQEWKTLTDDSSKKGRNINLNVQRSKKETEMIQSRFEDADSGILLECPTCQRVTSTAREYESLEIVSEPPTKEDEQKPTSWQTVDRERLFKEESHSVPGMLAVEVHQGWQPWKKKEGPSSKRARQQPDPVPAKQKPVVVSIICSMRHFPVEALGRELDELFAQRYFPASGIGKDPNVDLVRVSETVMVECQFCRKRCVNTGIAKHERHCEQRPRASNYNSPRRASNR